MVISGEGADEIFGGYVRYMPIYTTWKLKNDFKNYVPLFDKFFQNYLGGDFGLYILVQRKR